ncbi:MAG: hypothetical protein KAG61_09605 [Bacteriovoracaceae bacterium]|nr:hypothetical protein [Bacteriovoracaceae bacterium]
MKKSVITLICLIFATSTLALGLSRWVDQSGRVTQTSWYRSVSQCRDMAETRCENKLRCEGYLTDYRSTGAVYTSKTFKYDGKIKHQCRASCSAYCNVY